VKPDHWVACILADGYDKSAAKAVEVSEIDAAQAEVVDETENQATDA
jgi:hypothetical protein